MAQRLSSSSSQYLRQHAHQAVDWYPYGDAAFEQARLRDVPVMLSIGYSACHWCHVMSHESFDDPAIAALLNEHFVAIKVDREEHPLVDDTYMMAAQALTGAGGWPLTIFALPDGRTFHAGTYYPPVQRGTTPSFTQVLQAVHTAWQQKRDGLQEQAELLAGHLSELGARQNALLTLQSTGPAADALGTAVQRWIESTRPEGGMTPAPKFPATWALGTLARSLITDPARAGQAFEALETTLQAMLLGGLRDHLDGGFARYCVDENWSVPHFEKMLYDNAGLLSLCARTAVLAAEYARTAGAERRERAATLSALAGQAARQTARFLREQLLTGAPGDDHRALASSLDADSAREGRHVEGAYYTFSRQEMNAALDSVEHLPAGLVRLAEVTEDPGHYCLSLTRPVTGAEEASWDQLVAALRELRAARPAPGRDEKIVAGWNGLAVAALAQSAVLLADPALRELAEQVAETLWQAHWDPATLQLARVSFDGRAQHGNEATLEDYAAVALGFLALAAPGGADDWSQRAAALLERAAQFVEPDTGVPRDTVQLDPRLSAQRGATAQATVLDDAVPAPGSLYAQALARQALAAMADGNYTDTAAARLQAARTLTSHALALAGDAPTQVASALQVQALLGSGVHYLTLGSADGEGAARVRALATALGLEVRVDPALAGPDGALRIQPCREGLCQLPVDSIDALLAALAAG